MSYHIPLLFHILLLPSLSLSCPPSHRLFLPSSHLPPPNATIFHKLPHFHLHILCVPYPTRHLLPTDFPVSLAAHPNWALDRLDQPALPLDHHIYDPRLCSPRLASNISFFVIDTGCPSHHPLFPPHLSLPSPTSSYPSYDDHGHGTAVASLLTARTLGAAPEASLVCLKALNSRGTGHFSDVISSLHYAVERHISTASRASIAVLALTAHAPESYRLMDLAVARAAKLGLIVIAAAGNEAQDACSFTPGRANAAIAVAAMDEKDRVASFSNWGKCVDVMAPGVNVHVARRGTGTRFASGTSFAAPLVAGVVALRWDQSNGQGVERVRAILHKLPTGQAGLKVASLEGGCHAQGKYKLPLAEGWWAMVAVVTIVGVVTLIRGWAWRRDRWWRRWSCYGGL